MNHYFLIAGILCFVLGLAHTFFGEQLIFNSKREAGKLVPTQVKGFRKSHLRIIWATWHLASLFGWGIGAMAIKLSMASDSSTIEPIGFLITITACTMLTAAVLVLVATKGRHPGWAVLLTIGVLLLVGTQA